MTGDRRITEWVDSLRAELLRHVGKFEESGVDARSDDVDRIALWVLEGSNWHPPKPRGEQQS